jgi:hypothetical protein
MKTFEIELKRTSYITMTIVAKTQDEAEALAWKKIDADYYKDDGAWEVESIEELEDIATDETRSYGPRGATA